MSTLIMWSFLFKRVKQWSMRGALRATRGNGLVFNSSRVYDGRKRMRPFVHCRARVELGNVYLRRR
jgi:hypothetical protein